ncbi:MULTISPECIES: SURF1 family protein [Microbacterium]|uniref:SURF1 family cytochrome oxidase biogenesis protein n=1 Tax=Microbacterium TaxID=33882 RepID=UPI001987AA1A|nr:MULTISPECIES: SURF1 family protein [Microbacterium]MBD3757589.1 SURF1 family protein [Microbacterium sp.]
MNRRTALRWTGYVAVAIAFAIACAFLSNWQFTRNAERERQLGLIAANYDAAPVALRELIPAGGGFDPADQWHPVTLVGEYLTDDTLLARNRAHGGTSAFEVLVPFRTVDGDVFLVDRGWVPPGDDQPEPDAIPAAPTGQVTVVARLKPGEPLPNSGRSAPEGQVPTINLPLIAQATGQDSMVTSAYGLMVSEDPAPAAAPNPLESPSDDPGPHLSYAIQWILFAVMGFVFIWYMIRTEIRHRREDAEDAAAADAAAPASPGIAVADAGAAAVPAASPRPRRRREGRKRDRDMVDEDALLDELTPR